MWIIAMFDLPTETKTQRKNYTVFRKALLKNGYTMMQYSVYIRHCASEEHSQVHIKRIEHILPKEGEVRILKITEKQFERMRVFYGKNRKPTEQAPLQYSLF